MKWNQVKVGDVVWTLGGAIILITSVEGELRQAGMKVIRLRWIDLEDGHRGRWIELAEHEVHMEVWVAP